MIDGLFVARRRPFCDTFGKAAVLITADRHGFGWSGANKAPPLRRGNRFLSRFRPLPPNPPFRPISRRWPFSGLAASAHAAGPSSNRNLHELVLRGPEHRPRPAVRDTAADTVAASGPLPYRITSGCQLASATLTNSRLQTRCLSGKLRTIGGPSRPMQPNARKTASPGRRIGYARVSTDDQGPIRSATS
jgi:hypothetical protein